MVLRSNFNSELQDLKRVLIEMANATKTALEKTTHALVEKDYEQAEQIIADDDIIDLMEVDIENRCIDLILSQQPVASDLRLIFAINKISTDLERMADYAHSIAKLNLKMKGEKYIKRFIKIEKMSEIVSKMINGSIDAFLANDIGMAKEVFRMDDELDEYYHEIFKELMSYVLSDTQNINQAMNLLLIARYFERAGDHVQNICEWVYYNQKGKRGDLEES